MVVAEAEYKVLTSAACELQWISYLLYDMEVQYFRFLVLYCNNQSTLHIAANLVYHKQMKHLDIDWHIVYEKSQGGLMRLLPIPLPCKLLIYSQRGSPFHLYILFFPSWGRLIFFILQLVEG